MGAVPGAGPRLVALVPDRPRRLILWLREADVVADPPPPPARLVRRGLGNTNVLRGGHDMQIAATYSASDVEELERARVAEGP